MNKCLVGGLLVWLGLGWDAVGWVGRDGWSIRKSSMQYCRALVNERRNTELQIFQVLRRAYPHSFELKRRRAQTTTMKLAAVLCAVTSVTQTARAVPTESSVLKTLDNVYDEAVPPDEHYLEFRADYVELMQVCKQWCPQIGFVYGFCLHGLYHAVLCSTLQDKCPKPRLSKERWPS